MRIFSPEARRRLRALLLIGGTLWVVGITAGSDTASSALEALRSALPGEILRWELGDLWPRDQLSPAAVMTLRESPLLTAARPEVAKLRRKEEAEPQRAPEEAPAVPVEETPLEVPEPEESPDNGVAARTLVPTDPSGYTVVGRVYISTTRDDPVPVAELQAGTFDAELTPESPQILILHSHGSEAYTPVRDQDIVWSGDHRTTDARYNVVKAGDAMAEAFAANGISVLHDRTLYDYPSYAGSYDRSLAAIQSYLAQYPSIRLILDVHRDAIEDGQGNQYKVISSIEGRGTAAQMSLVVGSDGSGLAHPNWVENLKLAAALQQDILTEYPTLMRPLLLRKSRYNQHVSTGSLLVEVGAAGNSPEEAVLAGQIFAERMSALMESRSK